MSTLAIKWLRLILPAALVVFLNFGSATGQVSLVTGPYTENFNTLASSGTSAVTPAGWLFLETGTSSAVNGQYTAGTGSSNAGDTYSFGAASATDRSLGGLQSGTFTPTIGAFFTNNTTGNITSLTIGYTGEQWRLGTTGRVDQLNFQYSLDATSLSTGTWTSVSALNFIAPTTAGAVGALNGNDAANRTAISAIISSLNIPQGAVFYIRWSSFDATSADDGLGIDDFSLNFTTFTPSATISGFSPVSGCSGSGISVTIDGTGFSGVSAVDFNGVPATFIVVSSSEITATLPAGATSGPITVTAGSGAVTSSGTFTVNTPAAVVCPTDIITSTLSNTCYATPVYSATASGSPTPSINYSIASGSNFGTGNTPVVVTATNICATASCTFNVTVNDNIPPVAVCQDITVQLNAAGTVSITPSQVNNGSTDNCGTVNLVSVSPNTFGCANVNPAPAAPSIWINEIHYDNSGSDVNEFVELAGTAGINLANYALVRYNGNSPSSAVIYSTPAQTTTLTGTIPNQSNGYGTFAVFFAADGLQNGSSDGIALVNTSTNTVVQLLSYEGVFTVASGQGLASGQTSSNLPFSETGTLSGGSLRLSGTGNQYSNFSWQAESAPATPGQINSGQTFPAFSNTVTLTINDGNGNTSTCTANVTVQDTTAPVANCQNATVQLSTTGTVTLAASQINNNSTDACGISSYSVSPNTFTCANVGSSNPVILTVTDVNGNSSTCPANVTVQDVTPPVAVCQNISVNLNAAGTATITPAQINNGSTDACGIANLSLSQSTFNCSSLTGGSTNATDLFFSEYVEGTGFNKYIEVYNGTGAAINLADYQINLYSNGNPIAGSVSPLTGTLPSGSTIVFKNSSATAYTGPATVLSAINWNGNDAVALVKISTGQFVDIFGRIGEDPGVAWGTNPLTTIDRTLRRNGSVNGGVTSNPASGFPTLNTEWTSFPTDDVTGLGTPSIVVVSGSAVIPVTLTVTDVNGNSSTCTANVTVSDLTPPTAVCQNTTIYLNSAGIASLSASQVNNGSSDACGIASMTVTPNSFTCANIGPNSVTLTVTDINGNSSSCNAIVTVADNTLPIANCQNITVNLNAAGTATITAAQINNGSSDACGIASLNVIPNTFNCSDVNGDPATDLIISEYVEGSGNNKYVEIYNGTATTINLSDYQLLLYSNGATTATFTNTLSGTLASGSTIVYKNSGALAYGGAATVLSGVNWNGDDAFAIYKISTGQYVDIFGRIGEDPGTAWTSGSITTLDRTLRRKAVVTQGITINPAAGFPSLSSEWDVYLTDVVTGLGSHSISAANQVTLTVTDVNGNSSVCTAAVTVVDVTPPTAVCQNVTVQLNTSGTASITAAQINNGSSDACGIASMSVMPNSFSCANVGSNPVTLTVTDVNGLSSTCSATVTVNDITPPVAVCQNISVSLNATGTAAITAAQINNGSSDACGIASMSVSPNSFSCVNVGSNPVTLTVTDVNGLSSTCTATVTVNDVTPPVAVCQDVTVQLDASGNASVTAAQVNNGSSDACGIASISVSPDSFTCAELGTNTVTLTVTDVNGLSSTCTATVTVEDNILPVISCQGNITTNNAPGICGATVTYAAPIASDNCTYTVTQTNGLASGSVFPVGTTTNTFFVVDAAGNSANCSFSVTVNDTEKPVLTNCPSNITACNPVSWTVPTITDNCTGVTYSSNYSPGTNFPAGTTTVTYVAEDVYGNKDSCSFTVTRLDESVKADSITSNRPFNNICIGESAILSLNGGLLGSGASWKWYTGSCGGTQIATGVTSITVSPTTTTTYYARAVGSCNTTLCVSITITVSTGNPGNVTITSMPAVGAVGQTGVITVSPVANAAWYRYTSNLGHIASILFEGQIGPYETPSNSVNVTFVIPQQNYQIRVVAVNACGRSNNASGHIRGTVPAPTGVTGSTIACPGTPYTYTVNPVSGSNTYTWALVPASAGTITGNGGLTVSVTFNPGYNSAQLCVNGQSVSNTPGPAYCMTVSSSAPVPGTVTGNTAPCQNSSSYYAVPVVPGATGYTWTTSIGGASIAPGADDSAFVSFGNGPFNGTVCVASNSICNVLSAYSCLPVVSGTPVPAAPISGPVDEICGLPGVNYSVPITGANSYTWSFTGTGISLGGPNGTNSILMDFGSGFTTGTIQVSANYDCGSSISTLAVSGIPEQPVISPASICPGFDGQYLAVSPGADYFVWTTTGATNEFCLDTDCNTYYAMWGASGGTIAVVAHNTCGASAPGLVGNNCVVRFGSFESSVYPNPTLGYATVEVKLQETEKINIRVTELSGRMIWTSDREALAGFNQIEIDLSNERKGMYLVHVRTASGKSSFHRLAVE